MRKTAKKDGALIPLPVEKSLVIDNNKSHPKKGYVYKILENHYLSEVKGGRNRKVLIGSIDYEKFDKVTTADIGKKEILFKPNKNYVEIFGTIEDEADSQRHSELKYLSFIVLESVAKIIGLHQALKEHFPQEYKYILAMAFYHIIEERTTASRYPYFHYEYFDGLDKPLTSQEVSKLKRVISEESDARDAFFIDYRNGFHKWKDNLKNTAKEAIVEIKLYDPENEEEISVKDLEALRLLDEDHPDFLRYHSPALKELEIQDIDGTNRNSDSKEIDLASKGFNKSGPAWKKCIGELRITERDTGILLHYENLDGSVLDKTMCRVIAERLRELGFTSAILYVMDGGCYDTRALKIIQGAGLDYMINVPHHLNEYKMIKFMVEDELPKNDVDYSLVCHDLNGMSIQLEDDESTYYYIFYDGLRHELSRAEVSQKARKEFVKISRRKRHDALNNLVYVTANKKTEKDRQGRDFSASIDWQKVRDGYEDSGWILLRSSVKMTADEAMYIYRNRVPSVEHSYRISKSFLDDKASHMHSQETYEGHRFIIDVAAILRQALFFLTTELRTADSSMYVPKILGELDKFRIKANGEFDTVTFSTAMTRKQKEILKAVGLTESHIKKLLKRLHSWIKKK